MKYRSLGDTGMSVSEIGFGGWAIGADWGRVTETDSMAALKTAVELGVTFFDTADAYGGGRSEKLLARLKKETGAPIVIATKAGRRLQPHTAAGYTAENIRGFVEDSLRNLETEALDLLQLHCPPTEVYYRPELFAALDRMVEDGKLRNYGVSVEKVEEAIKAIEYPGVKTVQIIFNIFRQRPAEMFFKLARERKVGIIVRVPLASGLLTGKLDSKSAFAADDHRSYNRQGEAFDRGETFAGVDYESGLEAVEALKALLPPGLTLAQLALRWILDFPAVACTIPGAKRPAQVLDNTAASALPPLDEELHRKIRDIYEHTVMAAVHQRW
jgi:aryl-alcohol dehydrogenase-like predicted oxidoreductase